MRPEARKGRGGDCWGRVSEQAPPHGPTPVQPPSRHPLAAGWESAKEARHGGGDDSTERAKRPLHDPLGHKDTKWYGMERCNPRFTPETPQSAENAPN